MDIARQLVSRFLEPALLPMGFHLDIDGAFRRWSQSGEICCVVDLRSNGNRFSSSVGFCSPIIIDWFELSSTDSPTISSCKLCGIVFGLGSLLQMKCQLDGWQITDEAELESVGSLFRDTLNSNLPRLLGQFMTFEGWINHFRSAVIGQSASRGMAWSMLGYALLASGCSVDAIRQVLASHSQENGARKYSNRVDKHLEIQRNLMFERFGVKA